MSWDKRSFRKLSEIAYSLESIKKTLEKFMTTFFQFGVALMLLIAALFIFWLVIK